MRLSVEQVKQAMLHSDPEVREAAVFYFARCHSPDPSIMLLAMEAIERFGLDAFANLPIHDLVQTDTSVAWLIREIERMGPMSGDREPRYLKALSFALAYADADLLKPHAVAIQAMQRLDDDLKGTIADRIDVASHEPEVLWQELVDFCEAAPEPDELADRDYEYAHSIVDALSRYPEQFAERVLAGIADDEDSGEWLEGFMIRLAGRWRLAAAVPDLVDRLYRCGEWACEMAQEALARIGTDAVIEEISERYGECDMAFCLAATTTLEYIHSDLSVQTALELFRSEPDVEYQAYLLQAALMNFSSAGIEPARQFILDVPRTPGVLELRSLLLLACKVMGETFPEFDAWVEDSKADKDFRVQWYKDHPAEGDFGADQLNEDDFDEDDFDDDLDYRRAKELARGLFKELEEGTEEAKREPLTIVRSEPRVGRNDPCPCGSGKKFKKCCYGKLGFAESEQDH